MRAEHFKKTEPGCCTAWTRPSVRTWLPSHAIQISPLKKKREKKGFVSLVVSEHGGFLGEPEGTERHSYRVSLVCCRSVAGLWQVGLLQVCLRLQVWVRCDCSCYPTVLHACWCRWARFLLFVLRFLLSCIFIICRKIVKPLNHRFSADGKYCLFFSFNLLGAMIII